MAGPSVQKKINPVAVSDHSPVTSEHQAAGGFGFIEEYDLQLCFKQTKYLENYSGMPVFIGSGLLKRWAFINRPLFAGERIQARSDYSAPTLFTSLYTSAPPFR